MREVIAFDGETQPEASFATNGCRGETFTETARPREEINYGDDVVEAVRHRCSDKCMQGNSDDLAPPRLQGRERFSDFRNGMLGETIVAETQAHSFHQDDASLLSLLDRGNPAIALEPTNRVRQSALPWQQ